jgi:20S proteasome subunit alpha 6
MQKNLYDYSTLIWSPQGRIYQLEYAMEAVNQGNLLLGLKSKNHVVLCGLKSSSHDTLSYHQEKLFKVSSHMGMGVAGLTPDGSKIKMFINLFSFFSFHHLGLLHKYMKNETLNYNYVYNADYPVERLVTKIAESKIIIY